MKIAIFYTGYLPGKKYGGPVTSIYNFTELLGDDNELFIICTNHDLKEKKPYSDINPGWNQVGKAQVLYLSDSEYKKKVFQDILDDIKPDLIYASSIFSASQTLPLFDLSKNNNIPLILAPRGELNSNALAIKSTKKKIYLTTLKLLKKLSNTYFQATSEEEKKNILQYLSVNEDRVYFLPNVPIMPVHKTTLKKEVGVLKICFVGRIVENKNLLLALKAVTNASGNIVFDIYGPCEDKEYYYQCQQVINNAPDNIEITYKGALPPSKMRNTYAKYDCLISPTRFENYGQAIVEAILHDVPVIISRGTTPWDDIDEKRASYTVPIANVSQFTKVINSLTEMDDIQYQTLINRLRKYCFEKFDYSNLKIKYQECFNAITD